MFTLAYAASRVPAELPRRAALIPPYAIGAIATFWVFERVAVF